MKLILTQSFLWISLQIWFAVPIVESAKILGLVSFPGTSHWMMISTIMEELALRGHEVTVMSAFPRKTPLANYTDISTLPKFDYWEPVKKKMNLPHLFEMHNVNIHDTLTMVYEISYHTTEYALQHPNVQKLLHSTDLHFDLIMVEQFYQEAFLMFAHKFKAPVISMSTLGYIHILSEMMGNINPFSHVPHEFVLYDDKMSFLERLDNTFAGLYEKALRSMHYLPVHEKMVQKYFSHLPGPLPSLSDLEKNISVILMNAYVPLTTPRPRVIGMVEVGGVHIKDPKPLPDDIKRFLDGAKDGAIFFSLGSNLRSADMPREKVIMIIKVFGELKQRVLWKWEDDKIPSLPKNVRISKWMPQCDILAHPNMKVFITHGGLMSTQEGVYRGVPFFGIPIYADQHLNMHKAMIGGYGLRVAFPNLTEESFRWGLHELLYNPSYAENMRKISQMFRDRPLKAIDEAMFWVDYVIRYKGAPQLRSSARDMSWFTYFLFDIILIFTFGILSIVGLVCFIFKMLKSDPSTKKKSE